MTINSKNPLAGLSPQQLEQVQEELNSEPMAAPDGGDEAFGTDGIDQTVATRGMGPSQSGAGITPFDGGLHPGSGFPQGTLQTSQGYLVVPNTNGFGFQIFPPGTESSTDTPIAVTTDKGTLINQSGQVVADFKTNNQAQLPFGLTVTTHSSNPDDPFNGSISFASGGSQIKWNVVEGVDARLNRDTKINADSTKDLTTDKAALKKAEDDYQSAGTGTGWSVFSFLLAPFTMGLSAIGSAIGTGVNIAKGVRASKEINEAQDKVDADQGLIDSSAKRIDQTKQNVYEISTTRRFLKGE